MNEFFHGIGIGSGRLLPTVAAVVGLIGVVIGAIALVRSRRAGSGRAGAIAAAVLGLSSLVVGGLHSVYSAGGFGTGNGLAGAIAAIALGLVGMVLGGLALARSRFAISHQGLDVRQDGPDLKSGTEVGEAES